jgi:tetratricopeptide (TPR) repeat protein
MRSCDEIRPLLFALVEEEVTKNERRRIEAHVDRCRECSRELAEERAPTRLLTRTRRPRRHRTALSTLGLAACVVLVVLLLQPGTAAHGSIEPQTLTPEMTRRDGERTRLQSSNHIEVPTGEACRIRIRGVGTVQAEGPAMLELDQSGRRWKLVLLHGEVRAELERGAELEVVTLRGRRTLAGGPHFICLQAGDEKPAPPAPLKASAEDLIGQGHQFFFQEENMVQAERVYRAALNHPAATSAQRERARFYLGASLGRQGKLAEAVEVQKEWLKRNPKDKSRHHVLFFHGIYLWELGQQEKARKCWRTIVRQAPDSQMGEYAAHKLARGHVTRRRPRPDPGYRAGRVLAADAGRPGGYLVVAVALRDKRFREVAEKAAAFHKGRVVDFDGRDFGGLRKRLAKTRPEQVLYVVTPDVFDVNLHRRLLLLSAGLDEDILPDFAFGYLTARDGAGVAALWERTVAVHRKGPASKRWIRSAVRRAKGYLAPGAIDAVARAAGFTGDAIYWGTEGTRAEKLTFVDEKLPELENAAVIAMTGCGDPQGTWLFADSRNAESDKHWDFDPEKVGHDPDGEMPRITADHLRKLHLKSPIVFTGVCHAGATRRVFVEGDIVSTFGRTKGVSTLYELPSAESYCLAMIDAGAVAFLCPIAANHGASVGRETTFLLTEGASLGETIKSTYDELYLASRGKLRLDLQVEGKAHGGTEYVMQGGGANRILIGDPALKPYPTTHHPAERVEIRNRSDKGFEVVVTWEKGYHARAWDMYREDSRRDWCVRARISLDGLVPKGRALAVTASVHATGRDGRPLPYEITHAEPETYHGRRYLHLQATAPRKPVAGKYVQAAFRVTLERAP